MPTTVLGSRNSTQNGIEQGLPSGSLNEHKTGPILFFL